MVIIQITQSFFGHGAIMRRAREETRALLNAGHQVIVITDLKHTKYFSLINQNLKNLLIKPLKTIYLYRMHLISSELTFAFQVYYALKSISQKEQIDLIVSHSSTICYAVARFVSKKKIPAIWVIQDLIRDRMITGNPYNLLETLMFIHSNRYSLSKMPYLVAVSKYTRKLAILEGANPEKIFIKYNAIDIETFSPNNEKVKDIDVLFIGRLSIEKGVEILIDATEYLSPNRRIVIIGDGPLAKKLIAQARKLKKNIKFEGWIDNEYLPQFIRRAKLLVAPSLSECHASVPLEAMACGVPVIASRVAGMEDTIEHEKNGWLLEQNNAETLGNLIEELITNEEKLKHVSKAALERANFFSHKKFYKNIVKFYETLIEKSKF